MSDYHFLRSSLVNLINKVFNKWLAILFLEIGQLSKEY